jgi:hypothetical protein
VRTLTYNLTDPPILFDAYYLSAENAEPKLHDFTSQLKRKEDYKKKKMIILNRFDKKAYICKI